MRHTKATVKIGLLLHSLVSAFSLYVGKSCQDKIKQFEAHASFS